MMVLKRQHKTLYISILKEPPPHPSVPDARKSLFHAAKKPVSHPHIAFSAHQYRLSRTPVQAFPQQATPCVSYSHTVKNIIKEHKYGHSYDF